MTSAAATLREARITGAIRDAPAVEQRLSENSGLVSFENFDAPTEVQPGDSIPISVDVRNDAQLSGLADPDHCVAPNLFSGFRLDIIARIGGIEQDRITRCVAVRQTRNVQLQVRAPTTEQRLDVELEVVGHNSRNFQDRLTFGVDVIEGAAEQPCPQGFVRDSTTGDCVPVDDADGGGGGGGGDTEGPLERAEGILTLLIVLAGLAFVGGIVGGD